MIISKAIELQQIYLTEVYTESVSDLHDAIALGIEALKRIQNCRKHPNSQMYVPLPGESMPGRGVR